MTDDNNNIHPVELILILEAFIDNLKNKKVCNQEFHNWMEYLSTLNLTYD